MEVLDEKANGGPLQVMEVDEIVSVRDRTPTVLFLSGRHAPTGRPADDAFAAKYMPDLGHDVKEFQVHSWRINNWKKLEKKITSQEFECGGHRWCACTDVTLPSYFTNPSHVHRRILLFPFGNSNAPPNDTVSIYLDYANPKGVPEGWHACAQFALVISNIHDPTIYTVSRKCWHSEYMYMLLNFGKQTHIIASLPRNATGGSRGSASCESSSLLKKDTHGQPSRTTPRRFPYLCGFWRTQLVFSGITLSSKPVGPSTGGLH